jgi:ribosomal-protein-alanine N-acetyltransferase
MFAASGSRPGQRSGPGAGTLRNVFRTRDPIDAPLKAGRLVLRPLEPRDYRVWKEVRTTNSDWLLPWEPLLPPGAADPTSSTAAFRHRCDVWRRQRRLGFDYPFGMFSDGIHLIGEINLSNVQRGAYQSASVGYWVDRRAAGHGWCPQACVMVFGFAFDALELERLEVAIVPRNDRSRRVATKLGLRDEGIARQYLQIRGRREDHVRYGICRDEWIERRADLQRRFIDRVGATPAG